jgi:L-lactate dehydrogenase (cytochrome)
VRRAAAVDADRRPAGEVGRLDDQRVALPPAARVAEELADVVAQPKNVSDLAQLQAWTNEQFDPRLSWDDIAWIRERWGGKLILKGVLDVEDARRAADTGADALIVSNHGGRQLDGAPSPIAMLPAIAAAVGERIEVHLDGGIRSGMDVLRALCLGAKATYIGRPYLYGLGAMGEAGVTRVLEILRNELDITLALCGRRLIGETGPELLQPECGGKAIS